MRIALVNRKGGVGKSTTTINLGAALARARELGIAVRGYSTLVVDMDPQASASFLLTGGRESEGANVGHVLLEGLTVEEALRPTSTPGLSVVAASEALGEEGALLSAPDAPALRARLRDALDALRTPFDFVLIDCPPGLGLPMTMAMIAAERFLIPTRLERFSVEGTGRLFRFMERLIELRTESPERMAAVLGVLLTDVDYQLADAPDREAEIRGEYGSAVFDTVIRRNVTIERAQDSGRTIFEADPRLRSSGARCYRDLAAEVLLRAASSGYTNPHDLTEEVRLRGQRLNLYDTSASGDGR
jgi:chromosome partitioning protein